MLGSDFNVGLALEQMRDYGKKIKAQHKEYGEHFLRSIDTYEDGTNTRELPLMLLIKRYPASVEEFMFSPSLLARPKSEIFPAVIEELYKINNPEEHRLTNPYTEAVFTGGIGSAKTTTALYTIAYQLYVLSCFRDPHSAFGLDSTSEILMIFQSIHGELAQSVDYARFREICEQSVYFRTLFPYDPRMKKYLKFPGRIEVKAMSSDGGAIGQNVIGGLIDELNFMAITEKSKKSIDKGQYNQALTIYNSLARRRKSRFLTAGAMPGILCLVSSKRYPGEFTDKKIEEARTDKTIYIYDKRVWDIKPEGTYVRGWFKVFAGNATRKAEILGPKDKETDYDGLVVAVPEDYRTDFENDMQGSLRDIAGVGTLARYPFILNAQKLTECFGQVESVFSVEQTDFIYPKLHLIPENIMVPELPRWVHIDLAVSGDSAGVAVGCVTGFTDPKDGSERSPLIRIDGILRVVPPKDDEILFGKIRAILYALRDLGMNVRWASFDQFQSVDSMQILRQRGFVTGTQSVDRTDVPYTLTKAAAYGGRLDMPHHSVCAMEFRQLEKDPKTGKVDHPPNGSKDCSDAVAGVVGGLSSRREIWGMFGVPLVAVHSHDVKVRTPTEKTDKLDEF